MREALLLDLGAILFELHRQRRNEPELLRSKVALLTAVDDDLRELSEALGQGHELPELTARGLVASCTSCAGIMGIRDRHCPSCGAAAGMVTASDGAGPLGETVDVPAIDLAELDAALPQGEAPSASRRAPWEEDEEEAESGHGYLPEPEPEPEPELDREPVAAGSIPPPPEQAPAAGNGHALVPKAQRTLRAGRRRARAWLAERRQEGP